MIAIWDRRIRYISFKQELSPDAQLTEKEMAKPNTNNTTFTSISVVSGPMVSLVLPTYRNTFYYWNRLRVHSSLFPRKHHLADHPKLVLISCFPHCSKQRLHSDIQNAICGELAWVWGYVHSAFTPQKLGHSTSFGISTQCETYISVCVEALSCLHVDLELRSPTQLSTKTCHDFTSNGAITLAVDETCCPFACRRTEDIMSFVAMWEIGGKRNLNLRSMRSKTQLKVWLQFYYPIFFPIKKR